MIHIEIDDQQVRQALAQLSRRVADLSPAMHDIGQALVEGMRNRISEGRDWNGRPFAPNSPLVVARKGRNKPLVETGSFAGQRLYYTATNDAVEVGSSAVQSATLQFGAKRGAFGKTRRGAPLPWGDVPARPFLPVDAAGRLSDAARQTIIEIITEYLNGA